MKIKITMTLLLYKKKQWEELYLIKKLDKKLGYRVVTIKWHSGIKIFFGTIYETVTLKLSKTSCNRQILLRNIYVTPNNNIMLRLLDLKLEHYREPRPIPLVDFNAKLLAWNHTIKNLTKLEKFGQISPADITMAKTHSLIQMVPVLT